MKVLEKNRVPYPYSMAPIASICHATWQVLGAVTCWSLRGIRPGLHDPEEHVLFTRWAHCNRTGQRPSGRVKKAALGKETQALEGRGHVSVRTRS